MTTVMAGTAAAEGKVRSRDAILAASSLAVASLVAIAFGRFAYALVLPQMRSDLGWSYTVAGFATTVNALGYLAGALLATPAANRIGAKRAFLISWAATALAIVATGATRNTLIIMLSRGGGGLASGVVYVTGASLAAHLASQLRIKPGLALGLYQAGIGAGIVASGIVAGGVLAIPGRQGWQLMWLALGLSSIVLLAAAVKTVVMIREPHSGPAREVEIRFTAMIRIWPTLLGYFLFGLGYIAYMTFIVALLRGERAGASTITAFWVLLGVSAIVGSLAWGRILDGLRGGRGPAAVLAMTLIGATLPVLSASSASAIASGLIFGSSFLTSATAVIVLARRIMPPHVWTLAIGLLTAAFGVGQTIGPSLAGAISDGRGGIRAGLVFSCAVLFAAAVVLALQRESTQRHLLN